MSTPSSQHTSEDARRFLKCERCRSDKKSCEPYDRDWEGKQEKCSRCIRLGHACGPAARKEKSGLKRRSIPYLNAAIKRQKYGVVLDDIYVFNSQEPSSPRSNASVTSKVSPRLELALMRNPHSSKPNFDRQARRATANLGDLKAARDLLRQDTELCREIAGWVRSPGSLSAPVVRVALEANIRGVEADFWHEYRECLALVTDIGDSQEFFLSELWRLLYQFTNPPSVAASCISNHAMEGLDQKVLQLMLRVSREARGTYSDAELLSGSVHGMSLWRTPHSPMEEGHTESYLKAREAIKSVLKNVVVDDIEHQNVLGTREYPASHIAYMNGDQSTAYALWKDPADDPMRADVLGRTFLHHAVYAEDTQMVRKVLRYLNNPMALITKRDVFGLTPLEVAVTKDNVSCFSLMWQCVEDIWFRLEPSGGSITEMAASNGGQKVLKCIVQGRCPSLVVRSPCVHAPNDNTTSGSQWNDALCSTDSALFGPIDYPVGTLNLGPSVSVAPQGWSQYTTITDTANCGGWSQNAVSERWNCSAW